MAIDEQTPTSGAEPGPARGASEVDRPLSPRWRDDVDLVVFVITGVIAIGFVVWGIVSTENLASASTTAGAVVTNGGWFFVLVSSFFVVYVLWLAASRYGKIPLGQDGELHVPAAGDGRGWLRRRDRGGDGYHDVPLGLHPWAIYAASAGCSA